MDRRTVLRCGSVAALAASAGCAGLLGGGGSGSPDEGGLRDYLGDARGFEEVVDRTGTDQVTVMVGTGDIGQAFGPAGLRVSKGTNVVWEWTGRGRSHNVVSENGLFESQFASREGFTFSYTVEQTGVYKYYCKPHKASGMKGAIEVP